ncbi:titin-like isoform X2 [Neocloeon triangulifer]|uniref:titin-like isoform X2 n=1 Tax=Neocloeon triangulifer TaxID=2078957 RepID=UPI00286EE86C|nr:titin-like isoform X2 [Neocloeon triangulifer]
MLEHRQQQNPPFLVGERAVWLGSGSGLPQGGHVRWIGKLPGMGPGWTVGLELDKELPYGGIDGSWCGRQLFQCQTKHGLLVPANVVAKEDSLLRTFGVTSVINKSPKLEGRSTGDLPGQASPRANKTPIQKPKRTKSQSASSSKASSQQSVASGRSRKPSVLPPTTPDLSSSNEDTIRTVVKPVRRNSKKAREQSDFAKLHQPSPKSSPKVAHERLQRSESQQGEEVKHAFQPLPRSAFAPPLDSLSIDDSVLKLIAAHLPQLSTVSILSEPKAPKKTRRKNSEEKGTVDLSVLPASSIKFPEEYQSEKKPEEIKVLKSVEERSEEPVSEEKAEEVREELKEEKVEQEKRPESSEPEPEAFEFAAAAAEEKEPEPEKELEETEDTLEELEDQSEESPVPPPPPKSKKDGKSGYFHTAPARPNRHRASVKKRAPLPPINSGSEKAEEDSSRAEASAENSQLEQLGIGAPGAAATSTPPRVPLRRHNSLNGPRRPLSDVAPAPSTEELIYQWFDAIGDAPSAPPRQHVRGPDPMNKQPQAKGSPSISPSISCTSFEDAVAAADAIYSERVEKHFANLDSASSVTTSSSSTATFTSSVANRSKDSGNRRSGGGILSFLKWLRKNPEDSSESEEQPQVNSEGQLQPLSRYSSTNSLGTVVSAASSFAFVKPAAYPHNNRASLHYSQPTESDTYRLRLRQRDRSRILDKGLTFKRKYKLKQFACSQETVFSETFKPFARGKRKAPAPPVPKNEHYSEFSLPIALEHRKRMEILEPVQVKLHRRAASESSKDKRAGAYCHVRGKRKAPPPPPGSRQSQVLKPVNNYPSLGRNKKRQAPTPPPVQENLSRLSPDEKQRLINCINRARNSASPPNNLQGPALITAPPIILAAPEMPPQQSAPLSPKPWYKRSASKFIPIKQLGSKKVEEEMPEVNYARVLPSEQNKRKSMQFQALTKFSDIDKEAAALIQNNQMKAAELLAAENNRYYMLPAEVEEKKEEPAEEIKPNEEPKVEEAAAAPPTKGLISKFNALSNVTKVTVNSSKAALVGLLINNEGGKGQSKRISQVEVESEKVTAVEKKDKVEVVEVKIEKEKEEAKSTATLYPKLTALEAQPEPEDRKKTPLPLSIHGVPEGVTLNRQKKKLWVCPRCTLENENWRFTCDACNMWRPSKNQDENSPEAPGVNTVEEASNSIQKLANDVTKEEEAFKKPEPIGPIDWEAELKHYFPGNKKQSPERKPDSPTKINAKVAEAIKILEGKQSPTPGPVYVKAPEKKIEPAKKPEVEKPTPLYAVSMKNSKPFVMDEVKKKVEEEKKVPIAVPETFIGGRTEADEKKAKPQTQQTNKAPEPGHAVGTKEPTTPKDVDEMRKARLAFFNKEEKVVEAKPPASPRLSRAVQTPVPLVLPPSPKVGRTAEIATDTSGLAVVTLKEKGMAVVAAANAADIEEKLRIKEKLKEMKNSLPKEAPQPMKATEPFNKGAIKKSPPALDLKLAQKPNKVSSSAQTSGAIVKAATARTPVNGSPGVVKKIIARSPSFKGNGTFLLMGPKDFASIEATKSKSSLVPPEKSLQHVYANIPSPGLVPSGSPLNKNDPPKLEVKSPEPAAAEPAPLPLAPKSPSPNMKTRPGIKPVVVKVELNAQTVEDEYDDDDEEEEFDDIPDDQSSLSGAADSGSVAGSVGDSSDIEKLAGTLTGAKGLADFKADLAANLPQKPQNTLAVNRLLRRLENAIFNGQHRIAAGLARDLARLKINCKVERQRTKVLVEPEMFTVDMYVEDKVSHQGPIPLSVHAGMTVGELKGKVHQEFEIPADVQRWILGKQLASDDNKTLKQHSVATGGCVVFLYLVAPPERTDSASPASNSESAATQVVPTPPPPAEDNKRILPPAPENQRGPGWYYNFEEDRYSYCESSDDESDPEEEPKQVMPKEPSPVPEKEKTPLPKSPTPPLAEPEEESSDEEEENAAGPKAAAAFEPTAPPATLTQEKKTGTLQLGWTCPLCTLINPPTRPGCAACTTDRPANYKIPVQYETSDQEATRLKQEEENEKAMDADQATPQNAATNYEALVALDKMDLVANVEPFECPVCFAAFAPGEGAMLRECLHTFCRPCLAHTAQFSEEVEVRCPFRNDQYICDATMQEREVRALVPADIYEKMQAKSVSQAENKIQNAFHCKTPDCRGWCIFEDNVNDFRCPVCGHHNCLTCQAIHDGVNCRQYQERVTQASETDAEAHKTKVMLQPQFLI